MLQYRLVSLRCERRWGQGACSRSGLQDCGCATDAAFDHVECDEINRSFRGMLLGHVIRGTVDSVCQQAGARRVPTFISFFPSPTARGRHARVLGRPRLACGLLFLGGHLKRSSLRPTAPPAMTLRSSAFGSICLMTHVRNQ